MPLTSPPDCPLSPRILHPRGLTLLLPPVQGLSEDSSVLIGSVWLGKPQWGVCTWSGHTAIEWKGGFASGDRGSRTRFSQHIRRPPPLLALMDNPASPPLPVHWGSGHLSVHFLQCHPSTDPRSATSEPRSPSSGHPRDNRQAPRSSADRTTFLESTYLLSFS